MLGAFLPLSTRERCAWLLVWLSSSYAFLWRLASSLYRMAPYSIPPWVVVFQLDREG